MASFNSSTPNSGVYGAVSSRQLAESLPAERANVLTASAPPSPRSGYGLPCAQCKTYYAADMAACPICKSPQRVSPLEPLESESSAIVQREVLPDSHQLDEEREQFLRDFRAQQITWSIPLELPAATHCNRVENHMDSSEPAAICQSCYERLQERVDVLEAAMHIDIQEAAQIVYEAVWADPSDPSKTYQNAAQALLAELRRRSGVTHVFGPLQPPVN